MSRTAERIKLARGVLLHSSVIRSYLVSFNDSKNIFLGALLPCTPLCAHARVFVASHFGRIFHAPGRNVRLEDIFRRAKVRHVGVHRIAGMCAYACASTYMTRATLTSRYIQTIAARATNCAVCNDCRHALLFCRTIRRVVRLHTGCR